MNFFEKNFLIIKEEFNFLKINLKKEFLIKIIYIETMLFLKNKNNIKKINENLKIMFFLVYEYFLNLIKSLFNYENNFFFFMKQVLFFIIIMKYLIIVVIKKIIVSIFSLNYSIFIIYLKDKNLKKKTEILDFLSKDKFICIKYIFKNLLFFLSSKIIFFINYFI